MSVTISSQKDAARQLEICRTLLAMSRKERRARGVRLTRKRIEELATTFGAIEFAEEPEPQNEPRTAVAV